MATSPASASRQATSAARLTFSLRSSRLNPRSPLRPVLRLSPSSRYAFRLWATSRSSTATASVDFPDPDSPVSHRVAPLAPKLSARLARLTCPGCQVTSDDLMPLLPISVGPEQHAGAHGHVVV